MVKKSSIQIYFDELDELYLSLSNIYKKSHPKSDEEKKQLLENYISDYSSPSPLNSLDLENLKDLTGIIFSMVKINQKLEGQDQIQIDKYYGEVYKSKEDVVNFLNIKLNSIKLSFTLEELKNKKYMLKNDKDSIISSAWIQLSAALSNDKYLKICNHIKCDNFFSTSRVKMAYCSSKCQTRAKSYRAYHGELKLTVIKAPEEVSKSLEKGEVNRLNKEKYFIPKEYDIDFGFFDDQNEKNRILGS